MYQEYEDVEEGIIGLTYAGIGILVVLSFIAASHDNKKSKKSINTVNKDILSNFTRIPTSDLEKKISEIVKKYPVLNVDEKAYKQFLVFKKDCLSMIQLAESLIKKEHINLKDPIKFLSILKPFKVPYVVKDGKVVNMNEVTSLEKSVGQLSSEYKLSDDTRKKYLNSNVRRTLQVPSFNKSGKMIQIKSSELLSDFLSHDVLSTLNDACRYTLPWEQMLTDNEEGGDDFLDALYDSLKGFEGSDNEVNSLVQNHPYYKVFNVLSEKPKLVNDYSIYPLECYCKAIANMSKCIKLPAGVQESVSIYEIAKNYNNTFKLF